MVRIAKTAGARSCNQKPGFATGHYRYRKSPASWWKNSKERPALKPKSSPDGQQKTRELAFPILTKIKMFHFFSRLSFLRSSFGSLDELELFRALSRFQFFSRLPCTCLFIP